MMTVERQIEDMELRLPTWRMERLDERTAVWVGELCPYLTTYRVRIEHTVPLVLEYRSLVYVQPLIEVISPELQRKNANVEGSLPHVYWRQGKNQAKPFDGSWPGKAIAVGLHAQSDSLAATSRRLSKASSIRA